MSSPRSLSVIVPVRDGSATLGHALTAILATNLARDDYEIIVVDDASSDGSADIAARYADTVVRLTSRKSGTAYARNRGAELAQGDVLAFVDNDVMVQPDTLPRMVAMLSEYPGLDAVVASHSSTTVAKNLVSEYWNLLLNFGERGRVGTGGDVASPCAAIRRSAFLSTGMYDEWRFDSARLEGVDLGKRLAASGNEVLTTSELEVTGLSRWTVRTLSREVWNRSMLLARSLGYERTRAVIPGDVVFTLGRSFAAVFALLCVLAVSASFLPRPNLPVKAALVLAGATALNAPALLFFLKKRGFAFALAVAPLHLLMQGINAAGLCAGWLLRDTIGDRAPDAATQAYAEVGVETWPPIPKVTGS